MKTETVTIVSGLPRSGTSMMMSMLARGGLELLTDDVRAPDEDNPKGFFEFDKVKDIGKDSSWVGQARGRAVKIISWWLVHVPDCFEYKVIFMRRDMDEVLASQKQMLLRRGLPPDPLGDEKIGATFHKHFQEMDSWFKAHSNIEVVYISYNDLLADPRPILKKVNLFLGGSLDEEAMAGIVDRSSYRQRQSLARCDPIDL